jgi:hypothetical protein
LQERETNHALGALAGLVIDGTPAPGLPALPGANRAVVAAGVRELLRRGRAAEARDLVEAATLSPTAARQRPGIELEVAVAAALGDGEAMDALFARARSLDPAAAGGGEALAASRAFAEAGQPDRAAALFARAWDALRNGADFHLGSAPSSGGRERYLRNLDAFLGGYAEFLLARQDHAAATAAAAWCAELVPSTAARVLGEAFAASGRPAGELEAYLRPLHLSSGLSRAAGVHARRHAAAGGE